MLTTLLLITAAGLPATPPKVAALEWTTVKVDRGLASFFSAEFARALRLNEVPVVTSDEVASILGKERQRAMLGCADSQSSSCLAELGSALGCDATLVVNLAQLDGTYRANLKVLSSRDGSTLTETVVESDSPKGFVRELEGAAERLAAGLSHKATSLRARAWVPAVAGVVVAAAGVVCLTQANGRARALDAELAAQGAVTDRATTLATEGKTFQTLGWVGAGVGAAALVGAAAMALFGAEAPVEPRVTLSPSGASVGFSGVFP
jgi:hypothetical protein